MNIEKAAFLASIKSQLLSLAADLKHYSTEDAVQELVNIVDQLDDEARTEVEGK